MKIKLHLFIIGTLFFSLNINGQVRITKVMSSSGTGGTENWVEFTNIGNTDVDITGWKVDDNSFTFSRALDLIGITSIPTGKSVIFIEAKTETPATEVAAFKTFWGNSLDNISVGYYKGSGIGFGSGGDGAVLYKTDGTEISKVSFGAATAGKSFYWSYNIAGAVVDNGVISSLGTISGTLSNQLTLTAANVLANIGSPGTAIVLPLSANLNNPDFKGWTLYGNKLRFDILPTKQVEVFALTGSKVAIFEPAREINLILSKGLYILKVDNKATKIMIK